MNPLSKRRVVVTRPAQLAGELSALLEAEGAIPVRVPAIRIQPPSSYQALDHGLSRLADYSWVVFTSVNAVRAVLSRAAHLGLDTGLDGARITAVGPATRSELAAAGIACAGLPPEYRNRSIPQVLGTVDGLEILLPRSDLATGELPRLLRAKGARVDEVVAYRTTRAPLDKEALSELGRGFDAVTFTSSSAVRGLVRGLVPRRIALLDGAVVASMGPVTSQTVRELGLTVHVEARASTKEDLIAALKGFQGWEEVAATSLRPRTADKT